MTPATKAIYLDNAATTRVVPEVAEVVARCMGEDYGNPSSAHHFGIEAERHVKLARDQLAAAIGDPEHRLGQILWTSGGTEGDALGVLGAARAAHRRGHAVAISAIEHPAVTASAQLLAREGWSCEIIPVSSGGVVDVERCLEAITDQTTVVALMLVNNEIGTVQPVAELAGRLRTARPDVHVHCDAVQGLGKLPVDVATLGAHTVAIAAHKIHGPKGVGALWVARGARLDPLWGGGGQQSGLRPGTFNVPGIAGLGEAARLAVDGLEARAERFAGFAATLIEAARASGAELRINGDGAPRAPHIVSLAFADVPAEPLLHVLESRGVMVSAGSACSERDRKPSPVLSAIDLPRRFGTVRCSFGRETTAGDVSRAAEVLCDAVKSFR